MEEHYRGTLIIYAIIEFQKNNNNNLLKNVKIINDNPINNYIIAEFEIKKDKETIRIINSYEEARRQYNWIDKEQKHNEEEIKDNCAITINDEKIPFSYKHRFNKKSKYLIKYTFKSPITNINFLFFDCKNLVNINLSNFNIQNVSNMESFLGGCSSLININLSNFNTQNVFEMTGMFAGCSLLKNLNLSNFNTRNVTHMARMFAGCTSLSKIDLSNFNTQKDIDIQYMFMGCNCLKKEDIITNNKDILNEFMKGY